MSRFFIPQKRIPRTTLEKYFARFYSKEDTITVQSTNNNEDFTLEEFVTKIAEVIDVTDAESLTVDSRFRDLDEWDSLAGLSVISYINETFNKQIGESDIRNSHTIGDLYNLVKK